MDTFEQLLMQLEQMIANAKKSMFSGSDAVINRQEALTIIDRIRDAFPGVIREAQYLVQNAESQKQQTLDYCSKMVKDAEARRDSILSESEIIRVANEEAEEIKRVANDIRNRAEYEVKCKADQVLNDSEVTLRDALSLIRGYREDLRKAQDDGEPVNN